MNSHRLTWATITSPSRVMIPTYFLFSLALGLIFTFNPQHRLDNSHALAFPRQVMDGSMVPWGVMFLAFSVLIPLAFVTASRIVLGLTLCSFAIALCMWAVLVSLSVGVDANASYAGPAWPVAIAAACVASTLSVMREDR